MVAKFYDVNELFPVFELVDDRSRSYGDQNEPVEFTAAEIAQIEQGMSAFWRAQELIASKFGVEDKY
jgi:hypothetical protein